MKASKLRTVWIMVLSALYTANACAQAISKRLMGTINRQWVDETMRIWVDRILNAVGVRYKVINPHQVEPEPGIPTIIMCNHSSLYDIPLSLKAFPRHSIRMLAKKELAKIPLMGKGMQASEFPFIDRKNRHQAIKDLEFVHQLLESGIVMWIAPEGTRSKDGKLGPFKKGGFITAIQAKATIIPIGIRGAYDILPARTYQFNINQDAEIHIGKPIDAAQYTLENKEELIEKVHQVMEQLTGAADK
ncbi:MULTISPECIES: lysophospholipid acyltransferase family protein [Legionella]|uniref:1-acyl-sn-glycerol-3-phosphate acyltransferase n=1 Tax=Legionella septentrionalis TaxID=2498109 RepID=A0A433JLM0_9GAMM|nr:MULTISPECIES: lysophospholipid acyltransferase family protein [Legionella]MCP0913944.1 1-acyl-sn-glycerol-3-phosphate acyltransferase [Legionella sp. 27cVA30]RUQ90394.1 1-acyl-sn-glycerol-3-phosphate acyltransferase [Legionella septentrionalis]RUR00045.1 1-acyl-sn-glycerol-3-phosphate acyltransferase [Legionella septentrionalis]RUR10741.1 1-acyl-sn-glycerol-3-phosphate acyltransferase [Legionella septentrionalis]RUR16506.1 1-acyl-sn-glycerol-3-phosphate acyltransferase [Legionella septentri